MHEEERTSVAGVGTKAASHTGDWIGRINWAITCVLVLANVSAPRAAYDAALSADGGLDEGVDVMMLKAYLLAGTLALIAYSVVLAWRSRESALGRNSMIVLLLWLHTLGSESRGAQAHAAAVRSTTEYAKAIGGAIRNYYRANQRYPQSLVEIFDRVPTYAIPLGSEKPFDYRATTTGFVLAFHSGWYMHETTEKGDWSVSD
jgi:hypothetical protein